jgi:hypothetical protein
MLAEILPYYQLHHMLSLLNLEPPKPCDCFWKLSTYITFPGAIVASPSVFVAYTACF